MKYSSDLEVIRQTLYEGFSLSADVEYRELQHEENGDGAQLLFVKSLCDTKIIVNNLVKPFWEIGSLRSYDQYLKSFPGCEKYRDLPTTIDLLLRGYVGVFVQDDIYLFEAQNPQQSPINETAVETVVQGPQDGFNENLLTNLNLIRTRYPSDALRVEMNTVGTLSKTKVALVYDETAVDQTALTELKEQIGKVEVKLLQSAGQMGNHLSTKWALFPTIVISERPDRTVRDISRGKIIIVIDKAPFVAIVPSIFSDFLTSMDDMYQLWIVGKFLKALRYIGLFFAITMPSLYVGTVSFNPEVYRVQLAFSIASSRAAVPYPSYLEVIFMLLMMEFLTEASIRLPKAIGPTATTVGGLILGQAATEAGLVSNIMIIIVSVVALSNFVIPVNDMSFAVRILKYLLLLITVFYGLIGMVVGIVALIFYMVDFSNYGTPYVKLFRKEQKPDEQ